MFSRKIGMVAAVATLVMGLGATSASAQRIADSSGTTLANGSNVSGGPSSASLVTSLGNITCTSRFSSTVTSPSTVDVTSLTWASCSDTIPLFNVSSVVTDAGPLSGTVTSTSGTGGVIALTNANVTVNLAGGLGTCRYGATVNATANNAANTLSVSQSVPRTGGTFFSCPASGTFSVAYSPVWNDANGNGAKDAAESLVRVLP